MLMAFDYGTQIIGVAVGQSVTRTANTLTELKAKDGIPNWQEIEQLLREWQPDLVIVGLPLNMDGSESELSSRARKFANRLHGRFGVQVTLYDERLSSFAAKEEILQHQHSQDFKRHQVDSIAAKYILQSWFNA